MNIDLELLAKQKLSLLHIIDTLEPTSELKADMDGILHLIDAVQDEQEDKFPNGFKNWIETHHEIVKEVERMLDRDEDTFPQKLYNTQANGGTGGVWQLCEDLTDKFEQENAGVEWDGEYFEAIGDFLEKELA